METIAQERIAPEDATEALAFLTAEGYSNRLSVKRGVDGDVPEITRQWIRALVVDHVFRYEAGAESAALETVVLGVRFPRSGVKGYILAPADLVASALRTSS